MNKWIYIAILILFHDSQIISVSNRDLEITGSDQNDEVPVWIQDQVKTVAVNTVVYKWSFNITEVAVLDFILLNYSYPNPWLLNVTAGIDGVDSFLTLDNVTSIYTGMYEANGDSGTYSLNVTVHGKKILENLIVFLFTFYLYRSQFDFSRDQSYQYNRLMQGLSSHH
jgi:hypothetical protein